MLLEVLRITDLAPNYRRIIFGGPGFDDYAAKDIEFTDKYVKLVFLAPGVDYPEPLDLDEVRKTLPSEVWPKLRTFTVRWVDYEARELAIEFVLHGDAGLAGPWAKRAQIGDHLYVSGPGGAYRPREDADWHLMVGDESALPAIAASLEAVPKDKPAVAFIEVDGPENEIELRTGPDTEIYWLHRAPAEAGTTTLLDDAVRQYEFKSGKVQAFVHGEAALLKTVRPYLRNDRGVELKDFSVSAYWRYGDTDEAFRAWKKQQKREPQ